MFCVSKKDCCYLCLNLDKLILKLVFFNLVVKVCFGFSIVVI